MLKTNYFSYEEADRQAEILADTIKRVQAGHNP
jgi:hypothetical protein